jgi:hypothetical protein
MLLHRYRAILRRHRRVSWICVVKSRVGVQPSEVDPENGTSGLVGVVAVPY